MNSATLFYLARPVYGGWVTYLAHLVRCLALAELRVRVLRTGSTTEARTRVLAQGVHYQNVTVPAAVASITDRATFPLVVACQREYVPALLALAETRRVALLIHDTSEFKWLLPALAANSNLVPLVIRPAVAEALRVVGIEVAATLRPPFFRRRPKRDERFNAVAYARLDWDKNTDIIVGANMLLDEPARCHIYGAENTMYAHHKLLPLDPMWRRQYHGTFAPSFGAGADIAATGRFAVDMSTIARDMRGGMQLTFLEAWDAGACLVVHRKWASSGEGVVVAGDTALVVDSAEDLAELLRAPRTRVEKRVATAGTAVLEREFDPGRTAALYLDFMREVA